MQPSVPVRFPDKLRLRTPKGLPRAIEVAAAARHTRPSEWARQALLRGLEADGLALLPDGHVGPLPHGLSGIRKAPNPQFTE
jgi:hypothetical protein